MSYKIRKYLELADYAATRVTGVRRNGQLFLLQLQGFINMPITNSF